MTRLRFPATVAFLTILVAPVHAQITGELLAGIGEFSVQVIVDQPLIEAGVPNAPIKAYVEEHLERAGIGVVESGFPTIVVRLRGLKIRSNGVDFGYSLNISLRVEDMFIPMRPSLGKNEVSAVSYVNAMQATAGMDGVIDIVKSAMDPLMNTFLNHYRMANPGR